MSETDFKAPVPKQHTGGYRYHKPGCICIACRAARKRAEEAESGTAGESPETPSSDQRVSIKNDGLADRYSTVNKAKTILDADVPFKVNSRTARDRIAQWIALKTANPKMTNVQVAEKLGLAPNTLNTIISRARREGWLTFDNPLDRIEYDLIPKTLDNVEMFLDAGNREVTVEALKGFIVPTWKEARGISEASQTLIALKIELPEDGTIHTARGVIHGKPRGISGFTVDGVVSEVRRDDPASSD